MGLTAERVAQHYGITREQADQFALASHTKGAGRAGGGQVRRGDRAGAGDASPRRTRSRRSARRKSNFRWTRARAPTRRSRRWRKLKAVFHARGTVTAGNSSQTSDGAAAAVVMSEERAKALGIRAAGALRGLRLCRLPAGRDGDRPGLRHSQSAQAGGPDARSDRPDRTERSFRRAVAGRDQDARPRPWQR